MTMRATAIWAHNTEPPFSRRMVAKGLPLRHSWRAYPSNSPIGKCPMLAGRLNLQRVLFPDFNCEIDLAGHVYTWQFGRAITQRHNCETPASRQDFRGFSFSAARQMVFVTDDAIVIFELNAPFLFKSTRFTPGGVLVVQPPLATTSVPTPFFHGPIMKPN